MKLPLTIDNRPGELTFEHDGPEYRFTYASDRTDGELHRATLVEVEPGIYSVLLNGRSHEVKVVTGPEGYYVDLEGHRSVVEVHDPRAMSRGGRRGIGEGRQVISAPMPGKVVRVLVAEGDSVEAGAGLVVVEAMKMQNELKAPKTGKVVSLRAEAGATVAMGDILVAIE